MRSRRSEDWPPGSLRSRCSDAVDAGSPILAGRPVGFLHPVHVDDVVQRGTVPRSAPPSRQFGYPLPSVDRFAGFRVPSRVSGKRLSLRGASLPSAGSRQARFPVLIGSYESATTSRVRVPGPLWIRFQAPRAPPSSCSPRRSRSGGGPLPGLGILVSRSAPLRRSARGHARDLSGFLAFHPIPLPGSQTPAGPAGPRPLRPCPPLCQ